MNAEVRTFTAATMREALELVSKAMGPDAVILHTKQVAGRRFWPWSRPREHVEITAGIGQPFRAPAIVNTRGTDTKAAAGTGTSSNAVATKPAARGLSRPNVVPPTAIDFDQIIRDHRGAPDVIPRPTIEGTVAARALKQLPPASPTSVPAVAQRPAPQRQQVASMGQEPAAPPAPEGIVWASRMANPSLRSELSPLMDAATVAAINERLDVLQHLIQQVNTRTAAIPPTGASLAPETLPESLFATYAHLIDVDVEESVARELCLELAAHAAPAQLADDTLRQDLLIRTIASRITTVPPHAAEPGQRQVIALVGPTGVGKTTTIAKLAANAQLHEGLKVGLITVDTYRVAAVEQLRTYAEIMGLPLKVVMSPAEMHRALEELKGVDRVLIDTAGCSPSDGAKLNELREILVAAAPDDLALVLSVVSGQRLLRSTAQAYADLPYTSLVLTKLDEVSAPGSILTAHREFKAPIRYLTTGQNVPRDIESADPHRLAELIARPTEPLAGSRPNPFVAKPAEPITVN